jgi:hypothetical protein
MDIDSAHRALCSTLLRWKDVTLSEADTRAKLIDPVFRNSLGWSEDNISERNPLPKAMLTTLSWKASDDLP